MSVLPRGVCGPCFWALVFSWEPQLYQYNRSRLPDRTRKHWRRLDHWNGRGHCGSGAHPRGDRALWRSVSETDLYPEGTRILRAVQEQVRTVRGAVCGKRGGDEGAGDGLAAWSEMGGLGSGAGDKREADTGDHGRGGKDCSAAWSAECGAQYHAYGESSTGAGDS